MPNPLEIRNTLFNVVKATNTQTPRTSSIARSEHPQHPSGEDTVNLSPVSQELESVLGNISRLPEIREDRVEQIRQALKAETYRVSSDQIADRIIQETVRNAAHLSE